MNSEELRRADAAARTAALDAERSLVLQAPAGSGKTAVLVLRFLRLLRTVDDPGEILAITFTRKAAAEMRARVIRALRGELAETDPGAQQLRSEAAQALAHGARRGWNLARDPQCLRIQTIDSFNFWLASQLPLASRAGGGLLVTETPEELYRRAARATLAAADTDAELSADAELLFERLDNHWNQLERQLLKLLAQRAHWLPYVLADAPGTLCARVNASLQALTGEALARACALLPAALRAQLAALPGVGALGEAPAQLAAWQALSQVTLTREGRELRRIVQARHLPAAYAAAAARAALRDGIELLRALPGAEALLRELRALPAAQLRPDEAQALQALARLLKRAALDLQAEFAAQGSVDYSYIAGAARQALGTQAEPTDLALRAGLRLRHILVDEFQDTSFQQFELLQTLTASWEAGDGRSLFIVGDPMQSIYRFRDAEVGLFIAARDVGIGALALEPLRLACNFRAAPELVAWVNEVFGQVFPPADDLRAGTVTFSPSIVARTAAASGSALRLRLFPDDPAHERHALVARIAQLRAAEPHASIAVLVAAHGHATPIVAALEAADIGVLGVDLVPLAERQVVRDLVQLGRALGDLADRSAWLAVLRAPWCGARLETLTRLSAPEDALLLWEALHDETRLQRLEALERARLLRVRAVLAQALAERDAADRAAWLERTWLALGAADAYVPAELADAQEFFAALAARVAAGAWSEPHDFAALLQNLCSRALPAQGNAVQIMTIHRAKGLEFDHVLLPALERSAGTRGRSLLRWIDLPRPHGGCDLMLAAAPAVGAEEDDRLGELIGRRLDERTRAERTRLLYVAVTRARRTLWLSAAPASRQDGSLKPDGRSLLERLWPALENRFEIVRAEPAPPETVRRGTQRRLQDGWRPPPLAVVPARWQLPLGPALAEVPEFSWVRERQRHIGTIVHAWLQQLAGRTPLPRPADIAAERAALTEQLRLAGVAPAERTPACELILAALTRTLADERGRWLLAGEHREAHSELALTGIAAGRLQSVKVDRSFIDAAGDRWVIDYKTSRHEGADLEGFLARELERYRGQLQTYAALARALGPQPVRAGLYFPLLGAFREMT
jgi:ATP-dependent helicase/nuclease subunit A